jgi:hypothetical protein
VKTRWLLLLLLVGVGIYACGAPKQQVLRPAPETEIVLVYSSDDKGEYEECG